MFNRKPYFGFIAPMGEPLQLLIIVKEIREKIGKTIGAEAQVTL